MAALVYPVDNWQAGNPASGYTGRRLRQLLGGLVAGRRSSRRLGTRSGVWAGTPSDTVTVAGTTVTVAEHGGVLDVQTAAIAGPYLYALDAPVTFTVPAANASQARTDLVVVTVSDPAESDGSTTPGVEVKYVPGVPGAGTPATPVRSHVLARVAVPAGASTIPAVSWIAHYAVASGGIVPCRDSTEYPATGYIGQHVHDLTTNELLRWTGTDWRRPRGATYAGVASGMTNATGYLTVTHGLPFTPSSVSAISTQGANTLGATAIAMTVDQITSTTFRVRFLTFGSTSGGYWLMNWGASMAAAIAWQAVE